MKLGIALAFALIGCASPPPPKPAPTIDTTAEVRAGQCLAACIVVALQSQTGGNVDRCQGDCEAGVGVDPDRVLARVRR